MDYLTGWAGAYPTLKIGFNCLRRAILYTGATGHTSFQVQNRALSGNQVAAEYPCRADILAKSAADTFFRADTYLGISFTEEYFFRIRTPQG